MKHSITLDKYLQKTQELVTTALHIKKKPAGPLLEEFMRQFYATVTAEELEGMTPKDLLAAAESTFAFLQERPDDMPKIRIYNPTIAEHGWESEHTVVEMINTDMPFLVDSTSEELTRQGLHIYRLIHPVIKVQRDAKKKLIALFPTDPHNGHETAQIESVIHFQITRLTDKRAMQKVEDGLRKVLQAVRLAVKDWEPMLANVEKAIEEISAMPVTHPHSYGQGAEVNAEAYIGEAEAFLHWLKDGNFVFLGYVQYQFVDEKGNDVLNSVPQSELGIFLMEEGASKPQGIKALPPETAYFVKALNLIEITKSNRKSVVHRPVLMDYVGVKRYDASGKMIGEHRFLGLFTSTVYYQSAKLIPIIRRKIEYVIDHALFSRTSHSGKSLVTVLEAFPRDELFQISEEDLFETCMGIVTLATRPRVRLFVRKDKFERFVSCIIFVPREVFSTQLWEDMQAILCQSFHGALVSHYTQITDAHLARLHAIITTEPGKIARFNITEIEQALAKAASSWADELRSALIKAKGDAEGERLAYHYVLAFPAGYTSRTSPDIAGQDIDAIEQTLQRNAIVFNLYEAPHEATHVLQLKIYNPDEQLYLSDIMPMLENMGINAMDGQTFQVTPRSYKRNVWLHHFRFAVEGGVERPNLSLIKKNFETALYKIWDEEIQDDGFNKLILIAGLEWREVVLIRTYSKYLRQTGITYSQAYIEEALARHPALVRHMVSLFITRFDPAYQGNRDVAVKASIDAIQQALTHVTNIAEDRIIRRFVAVIQATLRTNYYQTDKDGNPKPYISLKFRSNAVPELPLPHPYAEIFVYSSRVEGIHLRGGKVARGGLRWSDRPEDFRTEVLGLMKAQMTKNAVIVPVGSKGGFVVKRPPLEGGRDALMKEGIECYRTFLRGLLDVTDNVLNEKIVTPSNVVRYDEDDSYLVVAADKGTATFSDYANAIAAEYQFWLGDAFASGGSAGYDHKKMGITARGAWISVRRHFHEMGKDIQTEDFTVVGIGDMAGDVFGNGMLLSPHIRLVGAFNHMHIFLDPTPDATRSYEERARLFVLPRSSWAEYDTALLSPGGMIVERSAKSITLTPEVKTAFDITVDALTPEALIQALLRAPIDLLWNGGIGTYVKASEESHSEVGDKVNDAVRVDASELRCKVMGEGGNLGFTQRGRIEYALNGGRINTDAIDNSAGVDCSDHEVNIKIALGNAIERGKLTLTARDTLLGEMTDNVAELVLRDNQLQTQALTIAQMQGGRVLEMNQRLMHTLRQEGLLDRRLEFLPSDETIIRRAAEGKGLTRPELAVLLAYSKMSIYGHLIASHFAEDPYLETDLLRYFPEPMRDKFKEDIQTHQLRREIIVTMVCNSIVNRLGNAFFHHVMEDTGMKGCDVARAYAVVRDIYSLRQLWLAIEALDGVVAVEVQVNLFLEIRNLAERVILWLLRNQPQPLAITKAVNDFAPGIARLSACLDEVLPPVVMASLQQRIENYKAQSVPEPLAKDIAGLDILASACDIVKVAEGDKLPINIVGKIYFELGTRLGIDWLRAQIGKLPSDSYWQRLSFKTLVDDLYDQQRRLTAAVIRFGCDQPLCANALNTWLEANQKQIARYDAFIHDIKKQENLDFPMLVVAVKRIEAICAV